MFQFFLCLNSSNVLILLMSQFFLCINFSYVSIPLMYQFFLCLNSSYVWILLISEYFLSFNSSYTWIHLLSEYFLCLNSSSFWIVLISQYTSSDLGCPLPLTFHHAKIALVHVTESRVPMHQVLHDWRVAGGPSHAQGRPPTSFSKTSTRVITTGGATAKSEVGPRCAFLAAGGR